MIRNRHIEATALEAGPFSFTAEQCANRNVVLAIQDTTTLMISTSLADSLGEIGKDGSGGRGILVHSTLAVDGDTNEPIGLLDQLRWQRSNQRPGKNARKTRYYEEKESFKWETASERVSSRVSTMENVITVCDREADVHEYLHYHVDRRQRFVVRAAQDRALEAEEGRLWEFMSERPILGTYTVTVTQRGAQRGRRARPARAQRTAIMEIRTARVTLLPPKSREAEIEGIPVHVVFARESNCSADETPLEWMILTSEPVFTKKSAKVVIGYYEHRWLIEEFHKSWKSGCRIEQRPVQATDNLERLAIITAHVAVRLLQLRSVSNTDPDRPCEGILTHDQWQCLWATVESGKPFPGSPPTILWAVRAIAKLAGWRDTKRTGRIGWDTLWKGWSQLEQRVVGWVAAKM